MKKILWMAVAAMMATTEIQAQNIPAGIRMEVGEAETDHGEYSLFTYKDTNEDDSFGYYLSVGKVTKILGAIRDDITDMDFDAIRETCICLGSTADEAFATLDTIIDLFSQDVETSVEFPARVVTGSGRLGEPTTSLCVVKKKAVGGKRLQFVFTIGKSQGEAYLPKTVVKELKMELKMDKKLHPKQHR